MKGLKRMLSIGALSLGPAPFALAQDQAESPALGPVQTALGEVDNFGELVSLLWSFGSKALIAVAIFFMILGAFFYMASAGSEEKVQQGKEMILGSLVSVMIVLLSGVLIRTLRLPAQGSSGNLAELPEVISSASSILIGLIGAFSILMLIYSSFLYFSAQGSREKIERAHGALKHAFYGLALGSLAYGIVQAAVRFLL